MQSLDALKDWLQRHWLDALGVVVGIGLLAVGITSLVSLASSIVFLDLLIDPGTGQPTNPELYRLLQVVGLVAGIVIVLIVAYVLLRPGRQMLGTPLLLVLLALGGLAGIGTVLGGLQRQGLGRPEIALPILVLAGVMTLLVGLLAVVGFLHAYQLTDRRYALGLPEGSIRAVIALGLLLIFAIVSIFLYTDVSSPSTRFSVGLTQEEVNLLPDDAIAAVFPRRTEGQATVYDVEITVPREEGAQDFAQQLLTLLGTLVAALTAFYFGTKEVHAASQAAVAAAAVAGDGRARTELRDFPSGETQVSGNPGTVLGPIDVLTTPLFAALTWTLEGDADGVVKQVRPGEFEYVRGAASQDRVTITFAQRERPDAAATLTVLKAP